MPDDEQQILPFSASRHPAREQVAVAVAWTVSAASAVILGFLALGASLDAVANARILSLRGRISLSVIVLVGCFVLQYFAVRWGIPYLLPGETVTTYRRFRLIFFMPAVGVLFGLWSPSLLTPFLEPEPPAAAVPASLHPVSTERPPTVIPVPNEVKPARYRGSEIPLDYRLPADQLPAGYTVHEVIVAPSPNKRRDVFYYVLPTDRLNPPRHARQWIFAKKSTAVDDYHTVQIDLGEFYAVGEQLHKWWSEDLDGDGIHEAIGMFRSGMAQHQAFFIYRFNGTTYRPIDATDGCRRAQTDEWLEFRDVDNDGVKEMITSTTHLPGADNISFVPDRLTLYLNKARTSFECQPD